MDAFTTKAIKLPRFEVEAIMGRLKQKQSASIAVTDEHERTWELLCTCYNTVYAVSRIGEFCQEHDLHPGNYVAFYRDCKGKLRVYTSPDYPTSLLSAAVSGEEVSFHPASPVTLASSTPSSGPEDSTTTLLNEDFNESTSSLHASRGAVEARTSGRGALKYNVRPDPPTSKRYRTNTGKVGGKYRLHHLAKCTHCYDPEFKPEEDRASRWSKESTKENAPSQANTSYASPNRSGASNKRGCSPAEQVSLEKELIASGCSAFRAKSLVRMHMAGGSCPEVLQVMKKRQGRDNCGYKRGRTLRN
eukprot:gene6428-3056_t